MPTTRRQDRKTNVKEGVTLAIFLQEGTYDQRGSSNCTRQDGRTKIKERVSLVTFCHTERDTCRVSNVVVESGL